MDEIVIPIGIVLQMVGNLCPNCQAKVRQYLATHQFNIRTPIDAHLAKIVEDVAKSSGFSIYELRKKDNRRSIVAARRKISITARKFGISYPKIAAALCKHHTTIMSLVRGDEQNVEIEN